MKKILSPHSRVTIFLGDVVRRLPSQWVWPLSQWVGRLLYVLHGKRRRDVERAYRLLCEKAMLPDAPKRLALSYFEHQLMLMTAAYSMRGQPHSRFEELCEIEGLDAVREVHRSGRGLLVISFHFGTHLLSFVKLEREGFPITTVRPSWMEELKGEKLRRILFIDRETIYVSEGSGLASPVRPIVRALREGKIVGFAPDGDQGGALMEMPLFGGHYPMRRGLFEIIRLSRAPVVYAQGMLRNGKYYIWYSDIMEPPTNGTVEPFCRELQQFLQKRFEGFIREYPASIWWTKPMEIALGLRSLQTSQLWKEKPVLSRAEGLDYGQID